MRLEKIPVGKKYTAAQEMYCGTRAAANASVEVGGRRLAAGGWRLAVGKGKMRKRGTETTAQTGQSCASNSLMVPPHPSGTGFRSSTCVTGVLWLPTFVTLPIPKMSYIPINTHVPAHENNKTTERQTQWRFPFQARLSSNHHRPKPS